MRVDGYMIGSFIDRAEGDPKSPFFVVHLGIHPEVGCCTHDSFVNGILGLGGPQNWKLIQNSYPVRSRDVSA